MKGQLIQGQPSRQRSQACVQTCGFVSDKQRLKHWINVGMRAILTRIMVIVASHNYPSPSLAQSNDVGIKKVTNICRYSQAGPLLVFSTARCSRVSVVGKLPTSLEVDGQRGRGPILKRTGWISLNHELPRETYAEQDFLTSRQKRKCPCVFTAQLLKTLLGSDYKSPRATGILHVHSMIQWTL